MIESGPEFERQKANIMEALVYARADYLAADPGIERDIQMSAINHLLDVAIDAGFIAIRGAIDEAASA